MFRVSVGVRSYGKRHAFVSFADRRCFERIYASNRDKGKDRNSRDRVHRVQYDIFESFVVRRARSGKSNLTRAITVYNLIDRDINRIRNLKKTKTRTATSPLCCVVIKKEIISHNSTF